MEFTVGRTYTRDHIHDKLGGSKRAISRRTVGAWSAECSPRGRIQTLRARLQIEEAVVPVGIAPAMVRRVRAMARARLRCDVAPDRPDP
jgi:hypothetical protein